MDSVQYRRLQEQSVKGYSGGNELEIIFTVCWPILYALARNLFPKCFGGKRSFIFEFVTLILPIILLFTWPSVMYAVVPIVVSILAVNVAAGLLNGRNKSGYSTLVDEASQKNPIDNCRASIMTMVTLAILAVDFNVFPRRFAKTETFGFSLMDFGVGLVVFSFAFTSGRNLIKNPKMVQKKSILGLLIDTFKANFLLFALGFARFLMVRRTDYYVNAGEYGVHWNFFITLWVISILLKLSNHFLKVSLHLAGVLVAVFYQMMLSLTPLQNYILYSDRVPTSFLSLNREGIWSLAGKLLS